MDNQAGGGGGGAGRPGRQGHGVASRAFRAAGWAGVRPTQRTVAPKGFGGKGNSVRPGAATHGASAGGNSLKKCPGDGKGSLHKVFFWGGGGQCVHTLSGCTSVVRVVHWYLFCTNGRFPLPDTPAFPQTGVVRGGSTASPCRASVSLPDLDGWCVLPATPLRTRTAVCAVDCAPCQARRPPLRAGATLGRWGTNQDITSPIAEAQGGSKRTPGAPHSSHHIHCLSKAAGRGTAPKRRGPTAGGFGALPSRRLQPTERLRGMAAPNHTGCSVVWCGVVWCAEPVVTKWQWPDVLLTGMAKGARGCVCAHSV